MTVEEYNQKLNKLEVKLEEVSQQLDDIIQSYD